MTDSMFSGVPKRVNPDYSNWNDEEKENVLPEQTVISESQFSSENHAEYEPAYQNAYSGGYDMNNYNNNGYNNGGYNNGGYNNGYNNSYNNSYNNGTQTDTQDQPIFNPQVIVDDDQQNKLIVKNRPNFFHPRQQNSNEYYNNATTSNLGSIICSLVSLFTCLLPIVPLVTGGLGLFFSLDSHKKSKESGQPFSPAAVVGLICSALGMGINLFVYGGIILAAMMGL